MSGYLLEFLTVALLHLLAVMSPGPDFAVVSRYSVRWGWRTGCILAAGVGTGILVHVSYSLLGVAVVIAGNPWLYQLLLLAACVYFYWLGWQAIKSPAVTQTIDTSVNKPARGRAFIIGFMTNALNPKATLFFLALFTGAIAIETPLSVKAFYGGYMALATVAWFSFLALVLGYGRIRLWLLQRGYWFDRAMGVLLWALATHLLLTQLRESGILEAFV